MLLNEGHSNIIRIDWIERIIEKNASFLNIVSNVVIVLLILQPSVLVYN